MMLSCRRSISTINSRVPQLTKTPTVYKTQSLSPSSSSSSSPSPSPSPLTLMSSVSSPGRNISILLRQSSSSLVSHAHRYDGAITSIIKPRLSAFEKNITSHTIATTTKITRAFHQTSKATATAPNDDNDHGTESESPAASSTSTSTTKPPPRQPNQNRRHKRSS